jgi:hypothetical protein
MQGQAREQKRSAKAAYSIDLTEQIADLLVFIR